VSEGTNAVNVSRVVMYEHLWKWRRWDRANECSDHVATRDDRWQYVGRRL